MLDREKFNALVNGSENLDALLENLNSFESENLKIEEVVQLDSLPNFGGAADDTTGIFSWDEKRYLVQNESNREAGAFELVDRGEET